MNDGWVDEGIWTKSHSMPEMQDADLTLLYFTLYSNKNFII